MFDFKGFRSANDLTQIELANILRCGQPNISAMEKAMKNLEPEHEKILIEKFGEDSIRKFVRPDDLQEISKKNANVRKGTDNVAAKNENEIVISYKNGVPYYNVDFCGGFDIMFNDQTRHPDGWVNFQPFSKADSWANITGHSMEPLISHGDMIAIKKVEDWRNYMLYGEIYGIVTEEYRTVKRVRKSPNPDTIILEPVNKDYDTQELELKKILSVWAVIGCAKLIF